MTFPSDLRAALSRGTLTDDECARVLAWVDGVTPIVGHAILSRDREHYGQRVAHDVAVVAARDCDALWPHKAPHTVHRLAALPAEPTTGGNDAA